MSKPPVRRHEPRQVLGPILIALLLVAGCGASSEIAPTTGGVADTAPTTTATRPAADAPPATAAAEESPPGRETTTTQPETPPGSGRQLVPDVRFRYFDGSEGSPADFAGVPTVINFWASWCAPCVVEMPAFEAVYQELRPQVAFLGLNVGDEATAARALVERTGVTYPLGEDPDSAIFQAFGGIGMPTTVFVNASGMIEAVIGSRLRAQHLRALIAEHLGI